MRVWPKGMARRAAHTASWNGVPRGDRGTVNVVRLPEKYSSSSAAAQRVSSVSPWGAGRSEPDWQKNTRLSPVPSSDRPRVPMG